MLKIVHIQYSSKSAGSAAQRINNIFLENGVESKVISLNEPTERRAESNDLKIGKFARIISRIDRTLKNFLFKDSVKKFGLFTYPVLGSSISRMKVIRNADIIYLHWVFNGFLNLNNIEQLFKLNKPVIIFMHDMWWITGGCHYSFDCKKYEMGCNDCQIFPETKIKDLSYRLFSKKLAIYSKYKNVHFVAPSKWLYNSARNSLLTRGKHLSYIPNILDDKTFKKIEKSYCRKMYNINKEDKVIVFGAVKVTSPYKGWEYLKKAFEILKKMDPDENYHIIIFGDATIKHSTHLPFKTRFLGYLEDETSTSILLNAADVFLTPSLAETFGYVVMESLQCGTPVVGFDVGGIPDMIEHKKNGYLAKYKDAEDFAYGIKYCIQNKLEGSLSPLFNKQKTIDQHISLIQTLLSTQ